MKNFILVLIILTFFSLSVFASPGGVTGRSQTGCGSCHDGASNGVVTFSLIKDVTGTYTLTILGGDGTKMGVDITVSSGTLSLVSTTNLAVTSNEIRHTARLTNREVKFNISGATNAVFYAAVAGFSNWNKSNSIVTNVDIAETPKPNEFSLSQNYPNPFNPATTIRFYNDRPSTVKIVIINSLGQEIKELINGYMSEGNHSVIFDATTLSSGTYFYKMIAKDFISVKSLVLLK